MHVLHSQFTESQTTSKFPTQLKTTSILNMNQMPFTLNRSGPIGGLAYGTPKNAFIDRPPCDRSVLPTNLLPFGNVTRSSSDVLALINAMKLLKIEINTKTNSGLFIFSTCEISLKKNSNFKYHKC